MEVVITTSAVAPSIQPPAVLGGPPPAPPAAVQPSAPAVPDPLPPQVAGDQPAPPPIQLPAALPNTGEPGGGFEYGWWMLAGAILIVTGLIARMVTPRRARAR